ncbi:hypothetical protein KIL84_017415 [Mauremys mutica]|uniref:Uncharacterized protein n=1 Tax=Mauremys mutica TaxID=74926 RepID=A0A9D3X631_9SAUR|nr:hypothetical protein KIL84_017415 [Mauremys mutica]
MGHLTMNLGHLLAGPVQSLLTEHSPPPGQGQHRARHHATNKGEKVSLFLTTAPQPCYVVFRQGPQRPCHSQGKGARAPGAREGSCLGMRQNRQRGWRERRLGLYQEDYFF